MPANTVITLRKGLTSNWSSTNPVLANGEPGYDTTNNILKIGDGTSSWNSLSNHKHNIVDINVSSTDRLLGRSSAGAGVVEEIICTSAGRALIDDTDAATQRITLGLGTIAVQNANNITISGGSLENTAIGAITASSGRFSTITATGNASIAGTLSVGGVALGEIIDDEVAGLLVAGSGISLNYNDSANTLTVDTNVSTSLVAGTGISLVYNVTTDELSINTSAAYAPIASPAFTGNSTFTATTAPVATFQINSAVDAGAILIRGRTNDGAAILYFQNNSGTVNNGFLTGFNGTLQIYGGNYVGPLTIAADGSLTSQPTYDQTAAGSNVVVTSAGLLRRTSSSIKYKKDVEDLDINLTNNAIDNLRPVWYRSKNPTGDDKVEWSQIGLIAEEAALVEPRIVRYKTVQVVEENGQRTEIPLETPEPEDIDYGRLAVLLLAEIKNLKSRIIQLESQINNS